MVIKAYIYIRETQNQKVFLNAFLTRITMKYSCNILTLQTKGLEANYFFLKNFMNCTISIGLVGRVFANGPGDRGSIPG